MSGLNDASVTQLILLGIAVVIVLVIAVTLRRGKTGASPYVKNDVLFSPAERSFFGVLEQALGNEYRIFGKVRVADVVSVRTPPGSKAWQGAFNRINAKHFDFVLCARGDLSILCVIELDDQSHQQRKRQERDAFLVGVCKAIDLPLVQVPAQRAYSVADIRAQMMAVIAHPEVSLGSGIAGRIEPTLGPLIEESRRRQSSPTRGS